MNLIPSEKQLWNYYQLPQLVETGLAQMKHKVCLPTLNLQFLSLQDYLIRNYHLLQLETSFQIRGDIEDSIARLHVLFNQQGEFIGLEGWSRMACSIQAFTVHQVAPPLLGQSHPRQVYAEFEYDHVNMQNYVHKEWDDLQQGDILYLVSLSKQQQ